MTKYEWRKEFSRRLTNKMDEYNITYEILADRSGVSLSAIYKYMELVTTPSIESLLKISKCLHVKASYFIDFEGEEENV